MFSCGILQNIWEFKSMELSNVIWATSTLQLEFPMEVINALDDAVCRQIEQKPDIFSTQSVSNIVWAAGNHPTGLVLSERLFYLMAQIALAGLDGS